MSGVSHRMVPQGRVVDVTTRLYPARCILFVSALCLSAFPPLSAQQAESQDSEAEPGLEVPGGTLPGQADSGETAPGTASPDEVPQDEEPAPEEPSLFSRTLELDIRTAGYYELVSWVRGLGIEPKGSREELQRLLYDHYGITPPGPEAAPRPGRRAQTITIESASASEYFTLEQTDEQYVRLSGNVRVIIRDFEQDVVHLVKAEEVVFNQTEELVTARGSVEYYLLQEASGRPVTWESFEHNRAAGRSGTSAGESDEYFTGDSITFRIDSWEGAFFQGTTSRERDVEDERLTFYFSGDSIVRTEEDVILMNDGHITSCDVTEPHYRIRARKIWILAPGEWGLTDATLYIGRVPIFYIPFFFYPGDSLFFNPAFGYRDREGYFLQTTTYLIGAKPKADSSFSFLQFEDEDGEEFLTERKGLFLRKTDEKRPAEDRNRYLKLMGDIYSRLGGFIGLDGKFPGTGVLRNLEFAAGIGFSRTLTASLEGNYSPYTEIDGELVSDWNSSRLFGLELPFRYGFSGTVDLSGSRYSLQGRFALYSDRVFQRDFRDRAEDIDWGILFGMEEEEGTAGGVSQVSSYTWQLSGSYRPNIGSLSPWVSTLSLSNFRTELSWNSKAVSDPEHEIPAASPERFFFYPESLTYPSYGISMRGTIVSIGGTSPASSARADDESEAPGSGLKLPWETVTGETGEAEEDAQASGAEANRTPGTFRIPSLRTDASLARQAEPFTFDLNYSLNHSLGNRGKLDTDSWLTPDDIDFTLQYSALETSNTLNLSFSSKVYQDLFSASGGVSLTGVYRTRYNADPAWLDENPDQWDRDRESDYRSSYLDAPATFDLSYAPLLTVERLASSRITYALGMKAFSRRFVEVTDDEPVYTDTFFGWGEDGVWDEGSVSRHSLSFKLGAELLEKTQSLTVSSTLPPLDQKYTGTLSLAAWKLTGSLQAGIEEDPDTGEWNGTPISIRAAFTPFTSVSLSSSLGYDPELDGGNWNSFETRLILWDLNATFTMRRMIPYRLEGRTWVQEGEPALIPSTLLVSYRDSFESDPFWKNRITFSLAPDLSWSTNFSRFTDSTLSFRLTASLDISEFLELEISSLSQNNAMFLYIPGYAERLGVPGGRRSLVLDLLKSFNFFNIEDRFESAFKIRQLSVSAVHHLHDWDLTFSYAGSPQRISGNDGTFTYEWNDRFSIFLQWKPIPEVKSDIRVENDELTI